jgi:hypothetical protein
MALSNARSLISQSKTEISQSKTDISQSKTEISQSDGPRSLARSSALKLRRHEGAPRTIDSAVVHDEVWCVDLTLPVRHATHTHIYSV